MSIELTIRLRTQTTPFSCWWFAMAMILEYYGRYYPDAHYVGPFEETPGTRPYGPLTSRVYPTAGEIGEWAAGNRTEPPVIDVAGWFLNGIPNNAESFRQFRDVSGFQGIAATSPISAWTPAHVEAILRNYGPIMFIGNWNGAPHAIVVCGVSPEGAVVYADPAGGFNVHTIDAFRTLARRFPEFGGESLNPLFYPSPPQVRAFRANVTDPAPSATAS